jgi:hypothetical protein
MKAGTVRWLSTRTGRAARLSRSCPDEGVCLCSGRNIFGWAIGGEGSLTPVGDWEGVPETVAGSRELNRRRPRWTPPADTLSGRGPP